MRQDKRKNSSPPPWAFGDPLLSIAQLSQYASISDRQLRFYLTHPILPLPHYRPGGLTRREGRRGVKVLVRKSEFDRWLELWRARLAPPPQDLGSVVERAVAEVQGR